MSDRRSDTTDLLVEAEDAADLWRRVTSREALQAAWTKVAANQGAAGGDGVTIDDFNADLFANLTELRAELLSGAYRTGPHRKVSVPKKKPGYRILTIPSIRDRVVHSSIATALTPIFEPLFEDGSFAYRPGRGVVHAVERIERWRRRGYDVVIEADIVSYFDNVDQTLLREKLASILTPLAGSAPLLALIDAILAAMAKALDTPATGLVQGSPLSPLLANLYLDALDEDIEAQGVKIVRFADDFVILCKSEKKARKVLDHCVGVLAEHNLRLHEDGTRIVSFEKGFDFIGYLFLKTLALKEQADPAAPKRPRPVKSAVTDEGVIVLDDKGSAFDPGRRVLYVVDPRCRLSVRNRSFSVLRDDESELIAIPYKRIGRIEIGPGVAFARQPLDLALEAGIDVSVVDGFGQTRGIVVADRGRRAGLQLAQAAAVLAAPRRLAIARRIVEARIWNQRLQLMRLNREKELGAVATVLEEMQRLMRRLPGAESVEALRGVEGAATAAYWPGLGLLLTAGSATPLRRTRPARDAVNAVINFMTAILERDMRAAIHAAGLHPGFAFLHGGRDRHDGLVFDLMEPFRAPLTEGLPIFLFNARRLRPDMFAPTADGGVEADDAGRRAIVDGYETAVARRVQGPAGVGKLTWRAMMRHQAQSLAHALVDDAEERFVPFRMEG